LAPLAIAILLAVYNNVLNRWSRFHRGLYVPLNLALTAALLALALGPLRLDLKRLGLGGQQLRSALIGSALAVALAAPLLLASLSPAWARLVADRRVADETGGEIAYRMLVRIPFGTALPEEFAFRGVLVAGWLSLGPVAAAILSSLAFGLWHITPSLNMILINNPRARADRVRTWTTVFLWVLLTSAAGMLLVWLRLETGGLWAPFALHAVFNSLATLAAFFAGRRRARAPRAMPGQQSYVQ
jgi:membrane protease YdiL (CAAX protease family)